MGALSALGMVAPVATSLINTFGSIQANRTNYNNQVELQNAQNQWARNQELDARAYNSPLNQKNLMIQAGMNPNLANPTASFQAGSATSSQSTPNVMNEPKFSLQSPDVTAVMLDMQKDALREDVKSKELDNQRKAIDNLERKVEVDKRMKPHSYYEESQDENGNPVIDIYSSDYYDDQNTIVRNNARKSGIDRQQAEQVLKACIEDYPFMRQLTQNQNLRLLAEISKLSAEGMLLSEQAKLAKEFGIMPGEQGNFFTFLKMILRNPKTLKHIGEALEKSGKSSWNYLVDHFDNNDSKDSW